MICVHSSDWLTEEQLSYLSTSCNGKCDLEVWQQSQCYRSYIKIETKTPGSNVDGKSELITIRQLIEDLRVIDGGWKEKCDM